MTSDAAVMSKPVSRGNPFVAPPRPDTMLRSPRSFMSSARRQPIVCTSMSSSLPCITWASMNAASRLFAAVIACRSPVKWRFRSSIGTTCACPAPAAPPLTPKTGPSEAWRRHSATDSPILPKPCVSETEVVVLPSPALVGVTAVTQMILPSGRSARRSSTLRSILALYLPYCSTSSSSRPASEATSAIGRRTASWAISRLLFNVRTPV